MGKIIFWLGVTIALIGALIWLSGKAGLPLGKLPGDFAWKSGNFSLYFPLATSLIVSIMLTVVLNFIFWFLRK